MSVELLKKTLDDNQEAEFHEDYVIITDYFECKDIYLSYKAAQAFADGLFVAQQIKDEEGTLALQERFLEGTDMDPMGWK